MHYKRWVRYGDPSVRRKPANGEAVETFRRLLLAETDDCVIWPHSVDLHGYGQIRWGGRVRKTHQLALELRDPNRQERHACHAPGIGCVPLCMNYRHLRWGTVVENMSDRLVAGTDGRGEKSTSAKLTAAQVVEIRRRYASGEETYVALGDAYGVKWETIRAVVSRKTWAHI